MADPSAVLDHLLPRLRGHGAIENATLLEVESPAQLVALARDPKTARYLLARIDDHTALVDPGAEDALFAALRAAGHTPKTIAGTK